MKVAQIAERLAILDRAVRVGDGLRITIGAEAVEDDELRRATPRGLESELGAAQQVTARPGRRAREGQADVDAAHAGSAARLRRRPSGTPAVDQKPRSSARNVERCAHAR